MKVDNNEKMSIEENQAIRPQKLEKNSKSSMWPTDGKATNGFETKIRWSFFNPLDNFFNLKLPVRASVFSLKI